MITLDPSERWLFLGKTGSGKTELVKYFLRQVEKKYPIVIVDPNELWLGRGKGAKKSEWAKAGSAGSVDRPHLVEHFKSGLHVQCLQTENGEKLAKMVKDLMQTGDHFIYFDESEGIATSSFVPDYIRLLWKRGRAHKLGCWVATQVPRGIPKLFKSQAEHFVSLKVGVEDIKDASSIVHVLPSEIAQLKRYEWFYYDHAMDHGELHGPIPLERKK